MDSLDIRKTVDSLMLKKKQLILDKKNKITILKKLKTDILTQEKARLIISQISEQTQEKIKVQIEEIITLALQSVFDDPFVFELKFQTKRNRVEAVPIIKIGNEEFNPKDELGGAVIDIISFVFRLVLWATQKEKTRPIFILDEPFGAVGSLITKAGNMIKTLSEELQLQIIIISHDKKLIKFCNNVYKITKKNKRSIAELIK